MLAPPKPVRVLFDESHSEAWTIRPDVAEAMQPSHPADSSLARAASRARRPRVRGRRAHRGRARRGRARGRAGAGDRPPVGPEVGGDRQRRLAAADHRRDRRDRGVRHRRRRLVVLGETEQDKYGNNLNELLSRFGVTSRTRPCRTTTPPPRHAVLGPRLARRFARRRARPLRRQRLRPARRRQRAPASIAPARSSTTNGAKVLARTQPTASLPNAPLARSSITAPVAWSSAPTPTSSATTASASSTTAALWINLLYWAAQPGFAGTAAPGRSAVLDDPAWIRLQGRGRGAAADPERRRLGRHL